MSEMTSAQERAMEDARLDRDIDEHLEEQWRRKHGLPIEEPCGVCWSPGEHARGYCEGRG